MIRIMEKRDARKVKPAAQEEIRRRSVHLFVSGFSKTKIAQILEVHRNTVGKWIQLYQNQGEASLKSKKRGPKTGTLLQLKEKDQKMIRNAITDKFPEQLKLPFALWTREAVGQLIERMTGKKLDLRQVGRYLKRWGFTPQRPIKQAYQRNEESVKKWLEEEYPAIKALAKKEFAEIQWIDESGISSHDHRGRGYSLKGRTTVRKHNPSGERINKISCKIPQRCLQLKKLR